MKGKNEVVENFKKNLEKAFSEQKKEDIFKQLDFLIKFIEDGAFEDGVEHVREGVNW